MGAKELWDATKSIAFEDGASNRMLGKRCCPWFDKLTMRSKPLKSLALILSLSKDGAWISAFFSSILGGPIPTFASVCSTLVRKCRNQRTTSNFMILVELLNLTFERELAAGGTQMSNSLH